ncbi:MAG: extracellular solute-binding protein, partial [Treponema sp.]|nr:extracellular solute-binding protein [Treponema sp.]
MVQNGNWAWGQIAGVSGNKVLAENVKYLPIYTGASGEESQGLCIGTENFYCINSQASDADQKATADFIYWLYSSATGKDYVTNKLGFIAPFDTFSDSERPTDPLAVEISNWMAKDGITSVAWNFTLFPSQKFKDDFGGALLKYAQGTKTWDEVATQVVDSWAKESSAN